MEPPRVELAAGAEVTDGAIEALLQRVYVDGGFTAPDIARVAFAAPAVRGRGTLMVVRALPSDGLLGMVIVAGADGPARKLAVPGEAEMHLLAVAPEARKMGIGRSLIEGAVAHARLRGFRRMLLWTQPTMRGAQRLYVAAGFERDAGRDFVVGGRQFLVLGRVL